MLKRTVILKGNGVDFEGDEDKADVHSHVIPHHHLKIISSISM